MPFQKAYVGVKSFGKELRRWDEVGRRCVGFEEARTSWNPSSNPPFKLTHLLTHLLTHILTHLLIDRVKTKTQR
jgi:hypothetical protein